MENGTPPRPSTGGRVSITVDNPLLHSSGQLSPDKGSPFLQTTSWIKRKRKVGLLKKVVSVRLLMLISVALLVTFMFLINYFLATDSLHKSADSLSDKILENVVLRATSEVENLFSIPYTWAQFAAKEIDGPALTYEYLRSELWKIWMLSNRQLESLFVVSAKGEAAGYIVKSNITNFLWHNGTIAIYGPVENFDTGEANFSNANTSPINFRALTWWKKAIVERRQVWSRVYRLADADAAFLTTSYPMFDSVTGNLTAQYVASYSSLRVQQFLKSIDVSDNAVLWLMQPDGLLVACSDPREKNYLPGILNISRAQESNIAIVQKTTQEFLKLNTNNSVQFTYELNKKDIVVYVQEMTENNLGLLLFVAYPKSDFLHEVVKVQRNTLIVAIVVLFLSLIVGIWVTFLVTSPLSKLGKHMKEIATGDFDSAMLNPQSSSKLHEINSLQQDFQCMVNAVRSFGKYVPVEIVKHILQTSEVAEAKISQRDLTVMFTDIKGFTQMVEEMTPNQLSTLLSDYLNAMCAVITDNNGTIDKFIGDAIMALWNCPVPVPYHASRACSTAIDSLKALQQLNSQKWAINGLPEVQCRIGIHTGKALVGNLGSSERLSYTAVGDNVNLASRLESLNKRYNTSILISGEVYDAVQDEFLCRYLDIVIVQGKSTPTEVYELICRMEDATNDQINLCECQAEAVHLFFNHNFEAAVARLNSLQEVMPNDNSITLLLDRATEALSFPALPEDWTGFSVLLEK